MSEKQLTLDGEQITDNTEDSLNPENGIGDRNAYVTGGDKYHLTTKCQHAKRTREVKLEEVAFEKQPCSVCAEDEIGTFSLPDEVEVHEKEEPNHEDTTSYYITCKFLGDWLYFVSHQFDDKQTFLEEVEQCLEDNPIENHINDNAGWHRVNRNVKFEERKSDGSVPIEYDVIYFGPFAGDIPDLGE